MNINWQEAISIASPTIALTSAFFVRRSSQTARRALALALKTGQTSYESTKAAYSPVVDLFLTKIEYRPPTPRELGSMLGAESRKWATEWDKDSPEVVIEGRIINKLPYEILLTCRDHENSGRKVRYSHRNQSVFIIGGHEIELGTIILPPEQETTFLWIDRRPREEWIAIHGLHARNMWNDPALKLPALTAIETIQAILRREPFTWRRERKVKRSGFRIICETRMKQRMVTVWEAEVIQGPVQPAGRNEDDSLAFEERKEVLGGPLDDRVVHYRVDFDTTLTSAIPPKHQWLPGRQI
ncbi:hypothetical protein EES42_37585 [Streptomyces sp. ADI95-17]|nr:hypothetical protein EES42_37585 [Streptomyces sp. ADI95-17]